MIQKLDELRSEVILLKPDIITVTESWTHDGHTDAFLSIDGYELKMRQDREGRGGGILLYASKETISKSIVPISLDYTFNQVIACDIVSSSGSKLTLYTI